MGKRNGCHRTNVLHEPRNQANPVEPPGRPHARVTTTAELRAPEQRPLRRARSCNRHGGDGTPVRGDSRSTTSRNSVDHVYPGRSSSSGRRGGHYAARSWTHSDCGAGGEPEYPAKRAGWWPVEAGEVLRAHHVAGRPLRCPVYRLLHAVLSVRRADSLYRRRRTVQQIRRHHSTKLLWLWLMTEGGRGRKRRRDLRRPGRERHKAKNMTCYLSSLGGGGGNQGSRRHPFVTAAALVAPSRVCGRHVREGESELGNFPPLRIFAPVCRLLGGK